MCYKKIVLLASCFILSSLIICLSLANPFYISSDMDLITLIDILSMNSGQPPIHLVHPGAGMFFILYWSEIFFSFASISPHVTYTNLADSLEPMLVAANKINFARWINLMILVSIPSLLLSALYKTGKGILFLASGILLVASTTGFWVQIPHVVRTETFSIFFFTLAIVFMASGFSKSKKTFSNYFLILILLTLSYMTKIQSIFLVLSAFVVLLFFYPIEDFLKGHLRKISSIKIARRFLFLYISLSIISMLMSMEAYTAAKKLYFFNFTCGMPVLIGLILCSFPKFSINKISLLCSFFKISINKMSLDKMIKHFTPHFLLLFTAILTSIMISSTVAHNLKGFFYQAVNYFKLLFLRITHKYDNPFTEYMYTRKNLFVDFKEYWPYLTVALLFLLLHLLHFYKKKKTNYLICYTLVSVFLLFNFTLATRSTLQDTIWNHIFFSIFIMSSSHLLSVSSYSQKVKRATDIFLLTVSVFIFYKNIISSTRVYLYRYDYDTFFKTRYYDHIKRSASYVETMSKFYTDTNRKKALKTNLSRPFYYALQLRSLFPGKTFSITDISIPYKGSFLIHAPSTNNPISIGGCPPTICTEQQSFAVSLSKWPKSIKMIQNTDTDLYALRSEKIENRQCKENLLFEHGKIFFYKINCYNKPIKYNIDKGHLGLIIAQKRE